MSEIEERDSLASVVDLKAYVGRHQIFTKFLAVDESSRKEFIEEKLSSTLELDAFEKLKAWDNALCEICDYRCDFVNELPIMPATDSVYRTLVFWPRRSLGDEAAKFYSNNYFNSDDCPPRHSWIGMALRGDEFGIVAGVGDNEFERVEQGIQADAYGCLEWVNVNIKSGHIYEMDK